jgi:aminoglycoside phosphotransferase (APT) family kinase protein
MTEIAGTTSIRRGHELNIASLAHYLQENLEAFHGPLVIRQFQGGQSNPTYYCEAASGKYVLRKKPPGKLLRSAHAVDREYRVLRALSGSAVPVPQTRLYCDDDSVIGTPFYLMDFLPGRVFTNPMLPGLQEGERRAMYASMNDALVQLHRFNLQSAGLADFGRPEKYIARQIDRWGRQYEASKTRHLPAMEQLREWLRANIPDDEVTTVVHGDFRIGNLMFHPKEPRVIAVLDWELATLGHPLSDLAYNCMTYHFPCDNRLAQGFLGAKTQALGIPGEKEYIARYERLTGIGTSAHWHFYMAFSLFRTAAIQQGVYARSLQGNASSELAHLFGETFPMVAERGWQVATSG